MRKQESSKKRRLATAKRALKRNKRNTASFKKIVAKRLVTKRKIKEAEKKKFTEHLNNLFGKQK